jgi:hypothetical protein
MAPETDRDSLVSLLEGNNLDGTNIGISGQKVWADLSKCLRDLTVKMSLASIVGMV